MSKYRKPTIDDVNRIIEVTDDDPVCSDRRWLRQRLMNIVQGDDTLFPFEACDTTDTIQSAIEQDDYNAWMYARIKVEE